LQENAVGSTKAWENHPLWQIDPVMLPFHTAVRTGRLAGRRRKLSPNTSSSTCTPKPSKAWRPRMQSSGLMES